MPAENPNHKPMPTWYKVAGWVGGIVALVVLVVWLVMFGGWRMVKRALPPEYTSGLSDEPGDVRVLMPKADPNGAPWKQKAYESDDDHDRPSDKRKPGADEADDEDPPARGKKADRAEAAGDDAEATSPILASLDAAAARCDTAIAQVAAKAGDQAAMSAAEQAIGDLQHLTIPKSDPSMEQAAKERRAELVTQKKAAFEQAKRKARATHTATKTVGLYKSGDDDAEQVAQVPAGALVHVFLDTGKGWARVEVLDGDAAGQNGYVRAKALRKIEP